MFFIQGLLESLKILKMFYAVSSIASIFIIGQEFLLKGRPEILNVRKKGLLIDSIEKLLRL